eukprot:GHRR01002565.1.p3 GENE.GHRR01002565.1~~GHRR01002565.1.p3  ORF type:complete len:214 (+),score=116.62 GHRR01002565.1:2655-3296(+)
MPLQQQQLQVQVQQQQQHMMAAQLSPADAGIVYQPAATGYSPVQAYPGTATTPAVAYPGAGPAAYPSPAAAAAAYSPATAAAFYGAPAAVPAGSQLPAPPLLDPQLALLFGGMTLTAAPPPLNPAAAAALAGGSSMHPQLQQQQMPPSPPLQYSVAPVGVPGCLGLQNPVMLTGPGVTIAGHPQAALGPPSPLYQPGMHPSAAGMHSPQAPPF